MAVIDRMTPEGKRLMKELEELGKLECYAGFQSGPKAKERKGDSIVDSEVDLIDVAMFNELGTSHSPSRPFMRQSIDDNQEEIVAFCKAQFNRLCSGSATAQSVMQQLAVFEKGLIQAKIKDGDFAPNAPSTVKKKGSDKPLIDTGHMRQSVQTVIDRKGRK